MKQSAAGIRLGIIMVFAAVLIGLLAVPVSCSPSQKPTQVNIAVVGDDLEEWRPVLVSVSKNGIVSWVNNGNEIHSIISSEHQWSDQHLAPGQSFNFTFNSTGTFTYRDMSDTFTGTVFVK